MKAPVAISALMLTCVCAPASLAMHVVTDGRATAAIVLSPDAPEMVKYAADEFRETIRTMSGAELPVVSDSESTESRQNLIFIGESRRTRELGLSVDGLGYDGFRIAGGDGWLALIGKESPPAYGLSHPLRARESYNARFGLSRFGETGTLFAVYHLLEKYCGVRWYMPGELGEVIPAKQTITIEAAAEERVPDFEYRNLYFSDFPQDDEGAQWFRRAGFGGPAISINHSFHLIKRKYRDTHPEFFALHRGERDYEQTCMGHGNLCLSEESLLQTWVADIRQVFDEQPQQLIYPVMPNDGYRYTCECARCAAAIQQYLDEPASHPQAVSNYIWRFVNDIAKEIHKTHPDRLIGCCAYGLYIDPPTNIERLSPNVAVMICKTRRNYWNMEYKDRIEKLVAGWTEKVKQIYIWEYYLWVGYEPILRGLPVFFPHILADDLRSLKGISRGEFIEAGTWRPRSDDPRILHLPGLTHINYYLTGKLLWDADADVDALLQDYYRRFYGPAHDEMKGFWSLAAALWASRSAEQGPDVYRTVYREENIDKLMALLQAAVTKTAAETPERRRIELIRAEFAPVKERVQKARVVATPRLSVPRTATAPALDGILDDPCWQHAVKTDFVGRLGEEAEYGTEMFATWDATHLYFGFINADPHVQGMRAETRERDRTVRPVVYEDESIEIFLNPTPVSDRVYYQFVVNTVNTIWDSRNVVGERFAPEAWQSGIESRVTLQPDCWILEVKIPLRDLGIEPSKPGELTANFFRNRVNADRAGVVYSAWSPPLANRHHTLSRFGTLELVGGNPGTDGVAAPPDAGARFEEAYALLLEARAGDPRRAPGGIPTYTQAAERFAAAALTADDPATKLRADYHAALSHFLDLNIAAARQAAAMVLEHVQQDARIEHVRSQLRKYLQRPQPDAEAPGSTLLAACLDHPADRAMAQEKHAKLTMLLDREAETKAMHENLRLVANRTRIVDLGDALTQSEAVLLLAAFHPLAAVSCAENAEKVNQALCIANLRQIGVALHLYAQEQGRIPQALIGKGRGAWHQRIIPYTDGPGVGWRQRGDTWRCPSLDADGFAYGLNNLVHHIYQGKIETIPHADRMILVADSVHYKPNEFPHTPTYGGAAYTIRGRLEHSGSGTVDRDRHRGGANVLFVDGGVTWLPSAKLPVAEGILWRGQ